MVTLSHFCRKTFRWSPAYRDAVKGAEIKTPAGLRYKCKACGNLVERHEKQVDHIRPVVETGTKWNGSWDYYRDRLFVPVAELQVLCKGCHKSKTNAENQERRKQVEFCQHDDPTWCTDKCPKRSPKCRTKSRKIA